MDLRSKERAYLNHHGFDCTRGIKIRDANGKCERCSALGEEVHHKIRLTVLNVVNPEISLNQENLELLCKKCHNIELKRFSKQQQFDEDGNLISK